MLCQHVQCRFYMFLPFVNSALPVSYPSISHLIGGPTLGVQHSIGKKKSSRFVFLMYTDISTTVVLYLGSTTQISPAKTSIGSVSHSDILDATGRWILFSNDANSRHWLWKTYSLCFKKSRYAMYAWSNTNQIFGPRSDSLRHKVTLQWRRKASTFDHVINHILLSCIISLDKANAVWCFAAVSVFE